MDGQRLGMNSEDVDDEGGGWRRFWKMNQGRSRKIDDGGRRGSLEVVEGVPSSGWTSEAMARKGEDVQTKEPVRRGFQMFCS